ncbi:hypothetical protein [Chitinophaga solisilvae]|uniref:Uncharacterized protein n=1 Tax=Chitinophaga solisilvae TaxID=1233460 RepID=A0A3S1AWT4_9BACT|nr:hypothetical protein [Chitinophaga solisilvae]NSL87952.1 hypothetical protein [Chitinophaga solisilvae]
MNQRTRHILSAWMLSAGLLTGCHTRHQHEPKEAVIDTGRYVLNNTTISAGDHIELWLNKKDTGDYILRVYHYSGKLKSYMAYQYQQQKGYALVCNANGTKQAERYFNNEHGDGIRNTFNEKGYLVSSSVMTNGKATATQHYDPPLQPDNEQ